MKKVFLVIAWLGVFACFIGGLCMPFSVQYSFPVWLLGCGGVTAFIAGFIGSLLDKK